MLRSIQERIFVAVRAAANGIDQVWGPSAREMPNYRAALIDTAVAVNTAQASFDLRQEVERAAKWEIEVLHGVFNLCNHQVNMPPDPMSAVADENVHLEYAPTNPRDFHVLAVKMAEMLHPDAEKLAVKPAPG
jgi:carbonic anhydrase